MPLNLSPYRSEGRDERNEVAKRDAFTQNSAVEPTSRAGAFLGNVLREISLEDSDAEERLRARAKLLHPDDVVGSEAARPALTGAPTLAEPDVIPLPDFDAPSASSSRPSAAEPKPSPERVSVEPPPQERATPEAPCSPRPRRASIAARRKKFRRAFRARLERVARENADLDAREEDFRLDDSTPEADAEVLETSSSEFNDGERVTTVAFADLKRRPGFYLALVETFLCLPCGLLAALFLWRAALETEREDYCAAARYDAKAQTTLYVGKALIVLAFFGVSATLIAYLLSE